jgi:zinc protease
MNHSRRLSSPRPALALVALLAVTAAMAAVPAAHAGPLDATRVTLKNGMRVVLAPDSLATAVDVAVWFPAGARHEKPAQAGLALLAARLGFRNGASDPLAPLAAEGGTGTLVATPDLTSFSATVPATALRTALAFLAERMPGGATTAADLAAERAVLRAEAARPERTPVARALARLWAAAWPGHPYAWTGAAPSPGAEALTPADVDTWRRTRFAASSAVLTVAGAFRSDSALALIRSRFEGKARVPAPAAPVATTPRAGSRGIERIDSQARLCLVGWRGPGAGDPDAPALEMLAAWLGGSPKSRLASSLVTEWHLALAAQAGFTAQKDGSLLWAMVVVPPGADSSAVETTLLDAATAVSKSAPETFEIERARRQLEAGALFALQTARQRSQALGEAEVLAGDAGAAARRLDALHRLTADDLRRVAARVMNNPGRATVWMLPTDTGGAR